ncbi:hypothetical protein EON66_04265 [archaeon]|nr:MAG: hypothetical protein EON66_04265 [archaeon]
MIALRMGWWLCAGLAAVAVITLSIGIPVGIAQQQRADEAAAANDGCSYSGYMLQPHASPTMYNIFWKPQVVAPFLFEGRTDIDVDITADGLRCLQLHVLSLNITSISVDAGTGAQPVASWDSNASNQRIIVPLPGTFNTGSCS